MAKAVRKSSTARKRKRRSAPKSKPRPKPKPERSLLERLKDYPLEPLTLSSEEVAEIRKREEQQRELGRLLDRAAAIRDGLIPPPWMKGWHPPPLATVRKVITRPIKKGQPRPQSEKARRALLGLYDVSERIPTPAEMSDKALANAVTSWLKKNEKNSEPFPSDDIVGKVRKELLNPSA